MVAIGQYLSQKGRQFLLPFFGLFFFASMGLAHEGHGQAAAPSPMAQHWQERLKAATGTSVSVAEDEHGVLWSVSMRNGHLWLARSEDGGKSFLEATKVNIVPEAILADGQSRPMIAVGGGVIAVSWAQALPKLHTGHIRFARSTDGGKTFSDPVTVNDNRDEIGHSFNAMKMDAAGRLALVWLDGRDKAAATKAGAKHPGSSIYYALSGDRGASFAPNVRLAAHSCECCRIGLDFAPDGVAVAQWRHVFGGTIRDFALARLQPGAVVQRASEDDWKIAACPHHGGDLAIDTSGRRHLVWFTGSPKGPGIYYRYADGEKMSPPLALGNPDAQAGNPTVFARDGKVWLAWREFDGKRYRVMAQRSDDGGDKWSSPQEVAKASNAADLPLFVAGAVKPLLAWYADSAVRIFDLGAQP
jgi:hypothetical protein